MSKDYFDTVSMLGNEYKKKFCGRCDYPDTHCACGSTYFEATQKPKTRQDDISVKRGDDMSNYPKRSRAEIMEWHTKRVMTGKDDKGNQLSAAERSASSVRLGQMELQKQRHARTLAKNAEYLGVKPKKSKGK